MHTGPIELAASPGLSWLADRTRCLLRGFALSGFALAGGAVVAMPVLAVLSGISWIGSFTFPALCAVGLGARALAGLRRQLAAAWDGVAIPTPYFPRPTLQRVPHGWYWTGHDYHKRRWMAWWSLNFTWFGRDPATWRDILWLICEPVVGVVLALLPSLLLGYGLLGVAFPWVWRPVTTGTVDWYAAAHVTSAGSAWVAVPLGALIAFAGLALAPRTVRLHTRWSALLLRPTKITWLSDRLQRVSKSLGEATTTQAAELRRIERNLHDGAQARLVAMGLKLGAVERLIDRDPAAAKALVADTREASAQALTELRALVRGIHPPVLAERGLADAVRALALDTPLPVAVTVDLPGRAEPPIEAAAYFAVAESLTNIAKHAAARQASVALHYSGGALHLEVRDDGRGGADVDAGGGLAGIRRRLGTFDGVLTVSSPAGGPTVLTMEVPCALSSPKTSTSSGTE
ncbi:MAG TPA: histidine kinase [Mycobacteriales bacterium]|nr:histidine kinase [Mycobacteriales bacterium]